MTDRDLNFSHEEYATRIAARVVEAMQQRIAEVAKPGLRKCDLVAEAGKAVLEGMEAGLGAARPGRRCEDIASAFFQVLERYGIVKDNCTGYSIGLSYPPDWGERTMSLRRGDRTGLRPGMTFHFMTGLWMADQPGGDWGLELTESIVITETGAECLAQVPCALLVKG